MRFCSQNQSKGACSVLLTNKISPVIKKFEKSLKIENLLTRDKSYLQLRNHSNFSYLSWINSTIVKAGYILTQPKKKKKNNNNNNNNIVVDK